MMLLASQTEIIECAGYYISAFVESLFEKIVGKMPFEWICFAAKEFPCALYGSQPVTLVDAGPSSSVHRCAGMNAGHVALCFVARNEVLMAFNAAPFYCVFGT